MHASACFRYNAVKCSAIGICPCSTQEFVHWMLLIHFSCKLVVFGPPGNCLVATCDMMQCITICLCCRHVQGVCRPLVSSLSFFFDSSFLPPFDAGAARDSAVLGITGCHKEDPYFGGGVQCIQQRAGKSPPPFELP